LDAPKRAETRVESTVVIGVVRGDDDARYRTLACDDALSPEMRHRRTRGARRAAS
jgi:hypothetical protein